MKVRSSSVLLPLCVAATYASAATAQDSPAPPSPATNGPAAAALHGNPGEWFGPDAYPPDAIRNHEQGRAVVRLNLDAAGIPVKCSVQTSSGSGSLDGATCAIALARARFDPAHDGHGTPIASSYPLAVRWVLPTEVPGQPIGYEDAELAISGVGAAMSCTLTVEGHANPVPQAACQQIARNRAAGADPAVPVMLAIPVPMRPPVQQ